MIIKNLTPHNVGIILKGETKTFPRTGEVARVVVQPKPVGLLEGVPLFEETYGEVTGLPSYEEGVFLIVSRLVAEAAGWRKDLLVPGDPVRDTAGNVIGCRGLTRVLI